MIMFGALVAVLAVLGVVGAATAVVTYRWERGGQLVRRSLPVVLRWIALRTAVRVARVELALWGRRGWLRVRYSRPVVRWLTEVRYGTPHAPRWLAEVWAWTGGVWWVVVVEGAATVRELWQWFAAGLGALSRWDVLGA
jgi:hypothetical protein